MSGCELPGSPGDERHSQGGFYSGPDGHLDDLVLIPGNGRCENQCIPYHLVNPGGIGVHYQEFFHSFRFDGSGKSDVDGCVLKNISGILVWNDGYDLWGKLPVSPRCQCSNDY